MENELSFTKFLKSRGCVLRSGYYWSAKSNDDNRVIFTIWADQLQNNKYVLMPNDNPPWMSLPGAHELRKHIPLAFKAGVEVLGVVCHAIDTSAVPRKRGYYDEKSLLVLRAEEQAGSILANVIGEVDVEFARNGTINTHVSSESSALERDSGSCKLIIDNVLGMIT